MSDRTDTFSMEPLTAMISAAVAAAQQQAPQAAKKATVKLKVELRPYSGERLDWLSWPIVHLAQGKSLGCA